MTSFRRPLDYWLLWLVALTSLAVNVLIINALLEARAEAAQTVAQAAVVVEGLQSASFEYTVHIEETIPVSTTIPFSETVSVPINTNIPVNTTVVVPLTIPIVGTTNIPIPIRTNIPIDLTVDVPIDKAIAVNLVVPVSLDVPINIPLGDSALGQALTQLRDVLVKLAERLGGK